MARNFFSTVYDPRNNRLFGVRPDGTYTLVDINPTTRKEIASTAIEVSDTQNIIEVEVPSGEHEVIYLPQESLDNIVNNAYPINSEIKITNIGSGSLEVISYNYEYEVKSTGGAQLTGQWAEANLRCRGENDWIISGEVGSSNAKRYSVVNDDAGAYGFTGEGLTDAANPSLTLMNNQELVLTINATGHPFWIGPIDSTGPGSATLSFAGIENNGATSAVIRFRPFEAGTYHYNCQHHAAMNGTITVAASTNPSSPPGISESTSSSSSSSSSSSGSSSGSGSGSGSSTPLALTLTSSDFTSGTELPDNVGSKASSAAALTNPQLGWALTGDDSANVAEYRLSVVDNDAGGYIHWSVTDIANTTLAIAATGDTTTNNWDGTPTIGATSGGAAIANGWEPCSPPSAQTHTYAFVVTGFASNGTLLVTSNTLSGTYTGA